MSFEALLFYVFAALALGSAIAMVGLVRHVVAGALSLAITMVSLAGIYVLLEAHLVAVVQILVYAGAILVLFLFVLLLLDVREDGFAALEPGRAVAKVGAVLAALGVGGLLAFGAFGSLPALAPLPAEAAGFGGYRALGLALYGEYVVPVEVTGLVLLAAIIGAVVLARRRID